MSTWKRIDPDLNQLDVPDTHDVAAQAAGLRARGYTRAQIREALGDEALPPPPKKPTPTEEPHLQERIRQLIDRGYDDAQIAAALELTVKRVRRVRGGVVESG